MNRLDRISAGVDRVCLALAKACLLGIALTILFQIAGRYGLRSPYAWTEELARYLMVWGGLLGASCAFRRALDPVIVTVTQGSPPAVQVLAKVMLAATVVIFLAPVLYYAFFGAGWNFQRGFMWRNFNRSSAGLGVNLAVIGAAIPVTCLILLLHCAARLASPLPQPTGKTS
ncbi:TRAP transporter small permease [Chachezhania sediminis]|uniref:TRAP transporter small permease n=1 Tax=Chachezhania sediminis TaxID=2599291 RepID=UPI00131D7C9A|nr:TRAP transporter small permease subunit [Chachezhania sediminis]